MLEEKLKKIKESPLFLGLNDKQQEAVLISPNDNVLCLSGAGTGKTKTLVAKIAILIKGFNVPEKEILAVTFTNKAANEMKERIKNSFGYELSDLLIGTFHSIAYKLIKQEIKSFPDYSNGFSIMDEQDQKTLIKRLLKGDTDEPKEFEKLQTKEKNERIKELLQFINHYREAGISYQDISSKKVRISSKNERWLPYYKIYEKRLIVEKLIDFSGLLVLLRNALKYNENFFEKYSGSYRCILVDEFQDTNNIQFEIIKLLTKKGGSIFAVGDDDQSIYGFRGANIENIRNFAKNNAKHVIKLEQNYRSTKNILGVANNIISDINVTDKKLWTDNENGSLIKISKYKNPREEAEGIVLDIKTKINEGVLPEEIAILYRTNSQSTLFEEKLIKNGIDYKVVGGMKFFERKEIKDLIAHAKILISLDDINAFSRAISNPSSFGIGEKRLSIWQKMSMNHGVGFEKVIREVSACDSCASKFIKKIDKARKELELISIYEAFINYLNNIAFFDLYKNDEARLSRINELLDILKLYDESGGKDFNEFVNTSLINDTTHTNKNGNENQDEYCIHLSSIHASKGLEFEYVYLIGLNEELFPHQKAIQNPKELEEERRLMYVGVTRAKKELNISFCLTRLIKKNDVLLDVQGLLPSRYLSYINPKYIENRMTDWPPTPRPKDWGKYKNNKTGLQIIDEENERNKRLILNMNNRTINKKTTKNTDYSIGEYVNHKRFGIGKVINIIDSDKDDAITKIEIEFSDRKRRTLFLKYTELEKRNTDTNTGGK